MKPLGAIVPIVLVLALAGVGLSRSPATPAPDALRGGETVRVPDTVGCPESGELPTPDNLERTRAATLCLLNLERAKHGLRPLARHPLLELASQRHSDDMVRRRFFEHKTPDGVDPQARVNAVGYRMPWTGENLYAGTGPDATPVRALAGWMSSPGHRANILRAQFTMVGVGVSHAFPQRGATGRAATYTTDFGG